MRNKIILAMAAAGMMYGASVYAVDPPTAGPFGSGKILFTGTITNSPCDIAPGDDAITVPFGQISYRNVGRQLFLHGSEMLQTHRQVNNDAAYGRFGDFALR